MRYLLDTDVVIPHLRGRTMPAALLTEESFAISIITVGELLSGVNRSSNPETSLRGVEIFMYGASTRILNLSIDTMRRYAETRVKLERQGNRLDDLDLLIAATAMEHGLTLLTGNTKHFARVKGLRLEGQ